MNGLSRLADAISQSKDTVGPDAGPRDLVSPLTGNPCCADSGDTCICDSISGPQVTACGGAWSPRPKYISSGVWPAKAACRRKGKRECRRARVAVEPEAGQSDQKEGQPNNGEEEAYSVPEGEDFGLQFGIVRGEDISRDDGPRTPANPTDGRRAWDTEKC